MKNCVFVLIFLCLAISVFGQELSLRTDYIQKTSLKTDDGEKVGRGSFSVNQGSVNIPLSKQQGRNNWKMTLKGIYAKYDSDRQSLVCPCNEVVNATVMLRNVHPIKSNIMFVYGLGAGIYTDTTDFSTLTARNVVYSGVAMWMWFPRREFMWGVGVAATNIYRDVLVIPLIFVDWSIGDKYKLRVASLYDLTFEFSAKMTDVLSLKAIGELVRYGAPTLQGDKQCYISSNYYVLGFRPELNFGKTFSVSATAGYTVSNVVALKNRTLKGLFEDGLKYKNSPSPYFSMALKYRWGKR